MNNPYIFHPPIAPFTPRPCPPVPPPLARHPGLYEDMDGYTRKEVDDADARTLASAKKYTDEKVLPSAGIPKTYLAEDVQASLSKADTALQEHQDISTKADLVNGKVPSSQLPETPGQVQADWNEADTSDPSFIKNKPSSMEPTAHTHLMEDISDFANHRVWAATATTSQSEENTFVLSPFGNDVVFEDGSIIIFQCPANITSNVWYVKVGTNRHQLVWNASGSSLSDLQLVKAGDTCIVMFYENKIDGFQYSLWRLYGNKAYTAYQKPASGIPASDLASGVLPDVSGKADSTSLAPAFSDASTYAVGDYVTHEGLLYKCTTAVSTAGAWNAANWTAVAVTDEMGGGGAPKNVWYGTLTTRYQSTTWDITTTTGDFVLSEGAVLFAKVVSLPSDSTMGACYVDGTSVGTTINSGLNTSIPTAYLNGLRTAIFVGTKNNSDDTLRLALVVPPDASTSKRGVALLSSTVNNDEDKAATPKAVNSRAPLASPGFTGTPTAPTAAPGTNTTQVATTEFVMAAIAALRTELTGNS